MTSTRGVGLPAHARTCVLRDLPVQAGELEDLRDERVGDLQRGLRLAADAELHGAAGSRALRDRERRAAALAGTSAGSRRQGAGQGAAGPIVDSWRLSTSAASRRTTARSVIVTGAGGRLACGPRLGSWVIVTTRVAGGTRRGPAGAAASSPGRPPGSRSARCPLRSPRPPGPGRSARRERRSENVRSHDGGPKSASPGVNRRGRCACSQARPPAAGRAPARRRRRPPAWWRRRR